MNIRYRFISSKDEYKATNMVRNAFLAGNNGQDVEEIINAILTTDEIIKIGRRIQIANLLAKGTPGDEIRTILGVGKDTVTLVAKHLVKYPKGFKLVCDREMKVEKTYKEKSARKIGGSTLVFKKREYTGFTRKDVKR